MTGHPPSCARSIRVASGLSAGVAAVLSPVPLADELVLASMYAVLAVTLARIHRVRPGDVPWRALASTAVKGLAARAAANLSVALVPGVAAVANALSAAALTEVLGRYFDAALVTPAEELAAPAFATAS